MSTNEKREFSDRDYKYLERIWRASMDGKRSLKTLMSQYLNCSEVIERCAFDGEPFDCCASSVRLYMDDMLCFTLRTDQKRQNPAKDTSTESGLEVDISTDWRSVPPTYKDMADGFLVQAGSVYTILKDAIGVPNGMQVTVRLAPTKQIKSSRCYDQCSAPKTKYFPFYDPHGYNCFQEGVIEKLMLDVVNCMAPVGDFVPNDTVACGSQQGRILHDALYGKYDFFILDRVTAMREKIRRTFYNGKCRPFCTTWSYTYHIGYSALTPDPSTKDPLYSRSRIRVFFADFKYTHITESSVTTLNLLFSQVGTLAGLYVGLSVIGLFELLSYGVVIARTWISYKLNEREDGKVSSTTTGQAEAVVAYQAEVPMKLL